MGIARNIARLIPNASGLLPNANIEAVAATKLTGILPDANAPSGSVIQVVQGTDTGQISSSTSTFTNTGSSISITPTSATSRILIIAYMGMCGKSAADTQLNLRIQRNSTTVFSASALNQGLPVGFVSNVTLSFLDSPATTSSTTYTIQLANRDNSGTVTTNVNGAATIILMEIAG